MPFIFAARETGRVRESRRGCPATIFCPSLSATGGIFRGLGPRFRVPCRPHSSSLPCRCCSASSRSPPILSARAAPDHPGPKAPRWRRRSSRCPACCSPRPVAAGGGRSPDRFGAGRCSCSAGGAGVVAAVGQHACRVDGGPAAVADRPGRGDGGVGDARALVRDLYSPRSGRARSARAHSAGRDRLPEHSARRRARRILLAGGAPGRRWRCSARPPCCSSRCASRRRRAPDPRSARPRWCAPGSPSCATCLPCAFALLAAATYRPVHPCWRPSSFVFIRSMELSRIEYGAG